MYNIPYYTTEVAKSVQRYYAIDNEIRLLSLCENNYPLGLTYVKSLFTSQQNTCWSYTKPYP